MKNISLLIILLFTISGSFAQRGKVTAAKAYKDVGKLDKAMITIEETVDAANSKTESSIKWPETWQTRGEIYQAIFHSKDENYRKLNADPLTVAFESYTKALALDDKDRYGKSIKIELTLLVGDLASQAFTTFKEENYEKALQSFEQIMSIEQNPVYKSDDPNAIDTVIIFNAGLAAASAKKYDKAIEYYKKAALYHYNGARTYEQLTISYLNKTDTAGAINSMQEGLKEYPGNATILIQLINVYLKKNQAGDAMKYLDVAISKDSTNESFHFVRGTLFERLENMDEAVKCYQKAIQLKPDLMDAYFNIGIIYYNRGVKQVDLANSVPSNQLVKYEAEKSKADMEFKTALPYLEKAYQLKSNDKMTLESLKNIYYRLQMLDKHAEIVEKMKLL